MCWSWQILSEVPPQIIDYATNSDEKVFLICTEMGVFYELLQKNPEKKFFSVGHRQFCPNMKKIHLTVYLRALENPEEEVEMDEAMRQSSGSRWRGCWNWQNKGINKDTI